MFCHKCGTAINGASFCPSCGYPATKAASTESPTPIQQTVYVKVAPTNSLAVAGFVLSFLGWLGVIGFVLSLVALKQIRQSGGLQGGRGLAIAGAIIGGLWVLSFALLLMFFGVLQYFGWGY